MDDITIDLLLIQLRNCLAIINPLIEKIHDPKSGGLTAEEQAEYQKQYYISRDCIELYVSQQVKKKMNWNTIESLPLNLEDVEIVSHWRYKSSKPSMGQETGKGSVSIQAGGDINLNLRGSKGGRSE